ncbi:hypothetical protein RirG_000830 [Rhizophagus irregularis DAOM 197198w]|uniref:Uncharacterized protein n=1 Tax=Rhizophagus irregularis (strain DAOM 197198w) TaxID=1432141 RepID=A0A015M4K4_RHIIW|nr:hypothetical protein RirG_000830 [Rhizophagus irregularis DAOM 197198w]
MSVGTAVGAGRGAAVIRGNAKKKGATTTRKASTGGGRTKTAPFEKSNSEDSKLPQYLNQMATDYLNQAHQLGVETEEGCIEGCCCIEFCIGVCGCCCIEGDCTGCCI